MKLLGAIFLSVVCLCADAAGASHAVGGITVEPPEGAAWRLVDETPSRVKFMARQADPDGFLFAQANFYVPNGVEEGELLDDVKRNISRISSIGAVGATEPKATYEVDASRKYPCVRAAVAGERREGIGNDVHLQMRILICRVLVGKKGAFVAGFTYVGREPSKELDKMASDFLKTVRFADE